MLIGGVGVDFVAGAKADGGDIFLAGPEVAVGGKVPFALAEWVLGVPERFHGVDTRLDKGMVFFKRPGGEILFIFVHFTGVARLSVDQFFDFKIIFLIFGDEVFKRFAPIFLCFAKGNTTIYKNGAFIGDGIGARANGAHLGDSNATLT